MIAELEAERQRLTEAIIVLERLSETKRGHRIRESKASAETSPDTTEAGTPTSDSTPAVNKTAV